jgi:hypothetical protein
VIVSEWVCIMIGVVCAGFYLLGYCHGFRQGHESKEGQDG